jgi:hypothetical protein
VKNLPEETKSGLWYLASPYSKYPKGLVAAFEDVAKVAGALLKTGVACYSPIAHTHPIAINGELDPYDHSIWIPLDHHMMDAAKGMIIAEMDGWDSSYGIGLEIDYFMKAGKPIHRIKVDAVLG